MGMVTVWLSMVIKPWFTIWFNHTQKTMVYLPWFTMVVFLVGWAHNIFFMNRNKRIVQELASIIMPIVTPRLCTERVDSLRVHIQELRHTILRS